jgi:hypothetical protein
MENSGVPIPQFKDLLLIDNRSASIAGFTAGLLLSCTPGSA